LNEDAAARAEGVFPESIDAIMAVAFRDGDFAAVERRANELLAAAANETTEGARQEPVKNLLHLYRETGDQARATNVAKDFLAHKRSWAPDDQSVEGLVLAAALRGGVITAEQAREWKAEWYAAMTASIKTKSFTSDASWIGFYAEPAESRADAEAALAALPPGLTLPPRRTVQDTIPWAKVLLYAGRTDEALPLLRDITTACIGEPYLATLGFALLGQALDEKGDRDGACRAYSVVLQRWGSNKNSLTAEKVRARKKTLGCVTP
jgi:hypothetical protein